MGFLKLGGGEALARVVSFAATVYLARTLGASLYGVVVLAAAVLLYLNFVTDCGVNVLGVRDVAADPGALPDMVPVVLGARFLVGTVLFIATASVGIVILPQPDGAILAIFAVTLPLVGLGTRWVHLGLERAGHAAAGRVITELVMVALVLGLVRGPDDLIRVPLAHVAGEGAGALLLLWLLPPGIGRFHVRIDAVRIRELLRTSWPLILNAMLGLAIFNIDFIFLRIFRDAAAVGLYAAAYTLISFFLNLGTTYWMTLLPVLTRVRDDVVAASQLHDDSLAQVLSGAIPVAIGGCIIAPRLVDLVFGAAYSTAALPLAVLMWSIPVALIRNVSQSVLIAHQRQDQLMYTAAWAAGINIALNFMLIPILGMLGAAATTLATEAIRTALVARHARRLGVPLPRVRRFMPLLGSAVFMAAVVWWLRDGNVALTIAAGVASYTLALIALGVLRLHGNRMPEFHP